METTTDAATRFARFAHRWPQPGNRRDRERFDALTYWDQHLARKIADRLYDGTRTVARCWAEALDTMEDEGW